MTAEGAAPRVALMADTFYEINGAARTCREWETFARRHELPLLCVRWGSNPGVRCEGPVRTLEIARSSLSFRIDTDLHFDALFSRVLGPVRKELEQFRPGAIHVTSPGDLGIAGAILAAQMRVPLVLSWHTNLHEFAARRIRPLLGWLGSGASRFAARKAEKFVLDRLVWFFGRGAAIFAPNPDSAAMLRERTGKPIYPMGRGIDTALFHPRRRHRDDDAMVLGYVGRLMPEKNLRVFAQVADALRRNGVANFRFQITGAGSERRWLERNVPEAYFTGTLRGESLAQAYANLDVLLFPSRTDTFGNVVQEALASGVPAVVMNAGGPRFIVREGITGFIAADEETFCHRATVLAGDRVLRRDMAIAARRQVEGQTWDLTFTEVYDGYSKLLQSV